MHAAPLLLIVWCCAGAAAAADAIRFTPDSTAPGGLPAYRIETPAATYVLEKTGGGLASLIDRDGNDWLSFDPAAGSGAAGEFRGFPNAVHQQAGNYFHPMNKGTEPCSTKVEHVAADRVTISAVSENGLWACRYDFLPTHCTFTMTRMPADYRYWVLYEGTPGGQFDASDWWMTSGSDRRHPLTEKHTGDLPAPEWIAFGDQRLDRVLYLLHHEDDEHPDDFYQMNEKMTVFGFGRQRIKKYLESVPQRFTIGLLETTNHAEISEAMKAKLQVASGSILLAATASLALAAEPSWQRMSSTTGELPVPNQGDQQTCCVVADFDGDGVNDFAVGERTQAPSVVWYKYNGKGWDRQVIDNTQLRPEAGGVATDVDGDGDPDLILGADGRGSEMWWWENPRPDFSQPWKRRLVKQSGPKKHHDQTVGDYDGDGKIELVAWNQKGKQLLLFEIPDDPRSAGVWPSTVIYTWEEGQELEGFASNLVDVDLDGKIDLVGGGRWFKHLGDKKFEDHVIDDAMRFTQCAAGQLVEGGRPEMVFSPGDMDGDAKWYSWDGEKWVAHTLGFVVHGHTCEIADINADGHLDIFIGEMGSPGAGDQAKTYIWYGDGKGEFRKTVASEGQGIHEGQVADLDGDQDLDILMKPYNHRTPRIDVLLNSR
ncbi:MAG: FG-GAP repeat domain-containing protein [Planctomycetota bacterium]